MTCASCGRQIPVGARYCNHCGAEQSVPTPIAAVAAAATAALARDSRAHAANASHAEAGPAALVQAANQPSVAAMQDDSVPKEDLPEARPAPAYAGLPRRRGLAVALIVAGLLVGAAALVAWRMEASGPASDVAAGTAGVERDAPSTREEAAPATQAPPTHASETAPESAAGASTAPSARAGASSAGAAASGAEPAPVEIKQLPPRPPRVPRQAAERPPAPAAPVAPATSETVAPAPPARASVAVPAPAPVIDRWARMNDEMSRCTREDFISRVICSQRVRFRYCDGYWGKVAQCPASPAPERGQ